MRKKYRNIVVNDKNYAWAVGHPNADGDYNNVLTIWLDGHQIYQGMVNGGMIVTPQYVKDFILSNKMNIKELPYTVHGSNMINELFSKRPANLEEIVDNDAIPTQEQILQSKDFQVSLINDLINNRRNVTNWEVHEERGSMDDLQGTEDDSFNIDYTFNFKYKYKDAIIPMTLFINGKVPVDWHGSHRSATHWNPAESPEPRVDDLTLGSGLDLALFDDDGGEIGLTWLTPDLQTKVAKSIISPYL